MSCCFSPLKTFKTRMATKPYLAMWKTKPKQKSQLLDSTWTNSDGFLRIQRPLICGFVSTAIPLEAKNFCSLPSASYLEKCVFRAVEAISLPERTKYLYSVRRGRPVIPWPKKPTDRMLECWDSCFLHASFRGPTCHLAFLSHRFPIVRTGDDWNVLPSSI